MKKINIFIVICIMLVVLGLGSFVSRAQAQELSLSQLIELFIALEIIAPDKIEQARSIVGKQTTTTQEAVYSNCPTLVYNLYLGLSDSTTEGQVTVLQQFLTQDSTIYPEGFITGFFGPLTEQAVQKFQTKNGIVSSGSPDTTGYGVVGPQTRNVIREICGTALLPTWTTILPPVSPTPLLPLPPIIQPTTGTLNIYVEDSVTADKIITATIHIYDESGNFVVSLSSELRPVVFSKLIIGKVYTIIVTAPGYTHTKTRFSKDSFQDSGNFIIRLKPILTTTPPTVDETAKLNIFSPGNGDVWRIGETYIINYEIVSQGVLMPDTFFVYLEKYFAADFQKRKPESSILLGKVKIGGSFAYRVSSGIVQWPGLGDTFRIWICTENTSPNTGCDSSRSNLSSNRSLGYFSIVDTTTPPPTTPPEISINVPTDFMLLVGQSAYIVNVEKAIITLEKFDNKIKVTVVISDSSGKRRFGDVGVGDRIPFGENLQLTLLDTKLSSAAFFHVEKRGIKNFPPVIISTSGPAKVFVGEMKTWAIKAYDPESGVLVYSVKWGDESSVLKSTVSSRFQQAEIFSHSYNTAGTYYLTITVTDNTGQSVQTSIRSVTVVKEYIPTDTDITISVKTDKKEYLEGEDIRISVTAYNNTKNDITVKYSGCSVPGAVSYQIFQDKTLVYPTESLVTCAGFFVVTISAGGTQIFTRTHWAKQFTLKPGNYTITGSFLKFGSFKEQITVQAKQAQVNPNLASAIKMIKTVESDSEFGSLLYKLGKILEQL